jgi:hypothetical protein
MKRLKAVAVAAEVGTDLVEPDELRATTQENAAQKERPDPVHVQGIPTRNPLSFACREKLGRRKNWAAKARRHCGEFLPVWMVYGVHEAECRAPGSTKHEPGICKNNTTIRIAEKGLIP